MLRNQITWGADPTQANKAKVGYRGGQIKGKESGHLVGVRPLLRELDGVVGLPNPADPLVVREIKNSPSGWTSSWQGDWT